MVSATGHTIRLVRVVSCLENALILSSIGKACPGYERQTAYHVRKFDSCHFVISQMAWLLPGIWRWLSQMFLGIMGVIDRT
jgi:hypothetical protein